MCDIFEVLLEQEIVLDVVLLSFNKVVDLFCELAAESDESRIEKTIQVFIDHEKIHYVLNAIDKLNENFQTRPLAETLIVLVYIDTVTVGFVHLGMRLMK